MEGTENGKVKNNKKDRKQGQLQIQKGEKNLKCSQVTKLFMVAFIEYVITASVILDYICSLWKLLNGSIYTSVLQPALNTFFMYY